MSKEKRAVSNDVELFEILWQEKCMGNICARAFATLGKDIDAKHLNLFWKKGTRVKVVMVSRFGDMGLTTKLDAEFGYSIRINPGEGFLENIILENEEDWPKYRNSLEFQKFCDRMHGTSFATDHPDWFLNP